MVVVTYTSPKGAILYGILLKMENKMIEIAWDSTEEKHFSIGWINPLKQIGKIQLNAASPRFWRHRALKLISIGNIEEARRIYLEEEESRKQERLRKERSS